MSETATEAWDWPLIRKRCAAEARRVLRGHHDAEEVAQEAMIRAWRSRASCRTPEQPLPWCVQIARNEALRLLGKRRNVVPLDLLESESELEDHRASRETDRILTRVDLDRALQELSLQDRRLIALRYTCDRSHPEIAAELAVPEATARVHLHRAHKRLKQLL